MIKCKIYLDSEYLQLIRDLIEKSERVDYRIYKNCVVFYFKDPKIAKAVTSSLFDLIYCLKNIKI